MYIAKQTHRVIIMDMKDMKAWFGVCMCGQFASQQDYDQQDGMIDKKMKSAALILQARTHLQDKLIKIVE